MEIGSVTCDPEPDVPRQRIVMFDMFDPFVDLSNWTPLSSEHVAGDELVLGTVGRRTLCTNRTRP